MESVNGIDFSLNYSDIELALEEKERQYFFSTFEHLNVHHGFRKGCYSIVMGSTGSGKSSLMKMYALNASSTPSNVLLWLSEEAKAKYAMSMIKYCDVTGTDISRIKFFEESKVPQKYKKNMDNFHEYFKYIVRLTGAEIVLVDNITSSRFYGPQTSLNEQGKTVQFFKDFSKEYNIALVAAMHTASNVSDNMGRLFTTEDVRGNRSISIEASYFYALQKFTKDSDIYTFVRNLKHRDHDEAQGMFILKYDKDYSLYTGDRKVNFAEIKSLFESSDRLRK